MKRSLALLIAACLASAAAFAQAPMRSLADPVVAHADPESLFTSKNAAIHRNKQAALHIMRELLQCNQWDRAGEWLSDRYIQHNPMAASGLKGVQDYFINVAKRKPTPTCTKLSASSSRAARPSCSSASCSKPLRQSRGAAVGDAPDADYAGAASLRRKIRTS